MDRSEHLQWCKDRALEYLNRGDLNNAATSMMSDMKKHPETANYPAVLDQLVMLELMNRNADGVRRWIEGFN